MPEPLVDFVTVLNESVLAVEPLLDFLAMEAHDDDVGLEVVLDLSDDSTPGERAVASFLFLESLDSRCCFCGARSPHFSARPIEPVYRPRF